MLYFKIFAWWNVIRKVWALSKLVFPFLKMWKAGYWNVSPSFPVLILLSDWTAHDNSFSVRCLLKGLQITSNEWACLAILVLTFVSGVYFCFLFQVIVARFFFQQIESSQQSCFLATWWYFKALLPHSLLSPMMLIFNSVITKELQVQIQKSEWF